jgi:hypothetical protein
MPFLHQPKGAVLNQVTQGRVDGDRVGFDKIVHFNQARPGKISNRVNWNAVGVFKERGHLHNAIITRVTQRLEQSPRLPRDVRQVKFRLLHRNAARQKPTRFPCRLKCLGAGFGNSVVLLARTTADADRADNLAATFERNTAGKNHDAAVVGGVNSEKLIARLAVLRQIFGGNIKRP